MIIRCLPVDVYRFRIGDCTNNGISAWFDELLVACSNGPRSFDSAWETPLNFCMACWTRGTTHIIPAMVTDSGDIRPRPGWFMYGGNIADASDSRWQELTGTGYPLHIHDRQEN